MARLLRHRALLEGHHRDSHKCMGAVKDNPCNRLTLDHLDASHYSLHDSILLCMTQHIGKPTVNYWQPSDTGWTIRCLPEGKRLAVDQQTVLAQRRPRPDKVWERCAASSCRHRV